MAQFPQQLYRIIPCRILCIPNRHKLQLPRSGVGRAAGTEVDLLSINQFDPVAAMVIGEASSEGTDKFTLLHACSLNAMVSVLIY
jgi:hypothetical protein